MADSLTIHFKKFSVVKGDVKVDVDLQRFSKQFEQAQFWLDSQVMTDMIPFMPMVSGNFIQRTQGENRALAGSGKVIAAAKPFGRFLYEGFVMVDPDTGSPWAKSDAIKVLTDRTLQYTRTFHPDVTDHWFDAAKREKLKVWVDGVKERAGGGKQE